MLFYDIPTRNWTEYGGLIPEPLAHASTYEDYSAVLTSDDRLILAGVY